MKLVIKFGRIPALRRGRALTLVFLLMSVSLADAATRFVPTDSPTIQAAIDASSVGDTVLVEPGIYFENLTMRSGIVLTSLMGPEVTVVDGSAVDQVISCQQTSDATISGLTLRNGTDFLSPAETHGGGIVCDHCPPSMVIENNIIEDNIAFDGAAIYCWRGAPTILNNLIQNNEARIETPTRFGTAGGIHCHQSDPRIEGNLFIGNLAERGATAISAFETSEPLILNNWFEGNVNPGEYGRPQGCIEVDSGSPTISGNVFVGNSSPEGSAIHLKSGSFSLIEGNTMYANSNPDGGTIHSDNSAPTLRRNVVAFTTSGTAIECSGSGSVTLVECTDLFGNQGGDWVGCVEIWASQSGNFELDPLFCDADGGVLELAAGSPCLPGHHPDGFDCQTIGARDACEGACCFGNLCTILSQHDCIANGGWFGGGDSECDPLPCPEPAACCLQDGTCIVVIEDDCIGQNGFFFANDPDCEPTPCIGACCLDDGTCAQTLLIECGVLGGQFQGFAATCEPNPCTQPEACCFEDGSCQLLLVDLCATQGGQYVGGACSPNPCAPVGACCRADGSCTLRTEAACDGSNGSYAGDGISCEDAQCPILGGCCFGTVCFLVSESDCLGNNGDFMGNFTACNADPCVNLGSCCWEDASCRITTSATCHGYEGTWTQGEDCAPLPCELRTGACCLPSGACEVASGPSCTDQNGAFHVDEACSPGTCDPASSDSSPLPTRLVLQVDGPNPAGSLLRFMVGVPRDGRATLTLIDVAGRVIKSRDILDSGWHTVSWRTEDLARGHYYARLVSGTDSETRSIAVLR